MNQLALRSAARRLRTREEMLEGITIFQTKAWYIRKKSIQARVRRRVFRAQLRKAERLEGKPYSIK